MNASTSNINITSLPGTVISNSEKFNFDKSYDVNLQLNNIQINYTEKNAQLTASFSHNNEIKNVQAEGITYPIQEGYYNGKIVLGDFNV